MTSPAALAASADPQELLSGLVAGAERALPPVVRASALEVERSRSLADRMAGRDGQIAAVTLSTPDETLTLRVEKGPRWVGQASRVSGGIVIARRTLSLGEYLEAFAGRVATLAVDAAGDSAAAARALEAMGAAAPGSSVVVREDAAEDDLRGLAVRIDGRVPAEAFEAVQRIVALLVETLPRVAADVASDVVVRRTATVYLPDTLRAYLALPRDWAAQHVFSDGTTVDGALLAQLRSLESAATSMRDAALEDDASEVLINGRFLADRFPSPR